MMNLNQGFIDFFSYWLPRVLNVLVILIIGYAIALILHSAVASALTRLGLDKRLDKSPKHNIVRRLTTSPSELIGKIVYWLTIIVTITIALSVLNIPVFNQFIAGVYGYIPNILGAILILALALAVSTGISVVVTRLMGDTATGKIIATTVPVIIISIAGFAILEQLQIAPAVVLTTYIAITGSLALGFALAFGLGGVDVSRRLFEEAYSTGKKNIGQIKEDFRKGAERGQEQAEDMFDKIKKG